MRYDWLVAAAELADARIYVMALLGGEAGLRLGEMVALEWGDIDFVEPQIGVQCSAWKGQVGVPKGGRLRYAPMTLRLTKTLCGLRHLGGRRVLLQDDGLPFTEKTVQASMLRAARRAGLTSNGVHILRHRFCSHLVSCNRNK